MGWLEYVKRECVFYGEFKGSSGKTLNWYVDMRKLLSKPRQLRSLIEEWTEAARKLRFDTVAGIPTGGLVYASILAYRLGKPLVYVRETKGHGLMRTVEGDLQGVKTALVVDDVATTGNSILRAALTLRSCGVGVEYAYVIVDRYEGAAELLAKNNIILYSLTTPSFLLEGARLKR